MPCGYGMGFDTCGAFKDRHTKMSPRRYFKAGKDRCPKHGLKNNYDPNRVSMVKKIKYCPCM